MGCWSRWWKCTSITQRKKIDASAVLRLQVKLSHVICSHDDQDHKQQLPDDIIAEILSRLPPQHVIKFRYICKRWFALTSTQSFRELHYKNQQLLHTFVIQYKDHPKHTATSQYNDNPKHTATSCKELKTLFFNEKQPTSDGCFENKLLMSACFDITLYQMKMKPLVTQFYNPTLISSYEGFLLFIQYSCAESILIFHNPITAEQVTVTAPASRYHYCGFYFHSPTEEYRVLFRILDDDNKHHAASIGFAILGLRTKSLRRIRNFSHHVPNSSTPPIILNGALHWMVSGSRPSCAEAILSFGMESEEFHVMPHPGKNCVGGGGGGGGRHESHDTKMRLMEMDGQLCLCVRLSIPDHLKLEIWVLENYKEWIWVKKHVVMLGLWAFHVQYSDSRYRSQIFTVDALFIHDGELILDARSSENLHFLYNLKNGSLRRLEMTKLESGKKKFKQVVHHHPSLFSLHTKRFGYVLSLNEVDDRVAEWNLNQVCRMVHTYPGGRRR